MFETLLSAAPLLADVAGNGIHRLWYILPLIVVVSMVYAATKHELMGPILQYAWHTAAYMSGFLLIVFGIIVLWSWGL
jgi:hypothetical protein